MKGWRKMVFYGYDTVTGEIFYPNTETERKNCVKDFLRKMWAEWRSSEGSVWDWRWFLTEEAMFAYARNH